MLEKSLETLFTILKMQHPLLLYYRLPEKWKKKHGDVAARECTMEIQ